MREHKASLDFFSTMAVRRTGFRTAEGLAGRMIFRPPWSFLPEAVFRLGCSTAAWLADRLAVGELHLHQIPQAGTGCRGRETGRTFRGRIPASLSCAPAVVDLVGLREGNTGTAALAGLLAAATPRNVITLASFTAGSRREEQASSVHGVPP